jgi:hypothetical protein
MMSGANWEMEYRDSAILSLLGSMLKKSATIQEIQIWLQNNENDVATDFADPQCWSSLLSIVGALETYNKDESGPILDLLIEHGLVRDPEILAQFCLNKDTLLSRLLLEHGWEANKVQSQTAADSSPEIRALLDEYLLLGKGDGSTPLC